MREARTIVIGLDSMDLRLIQGWNALGELPCLQALLAGGSLVKLDTPSRVLQGSVWPSLLTGASPGRHGLYLQNQLKSGTYTLTDMFADHVRLRRFYEYLGDAGVRCGLADIPTDRPLADIRGVQVVDWATEFNFWRYETVPRSFARVIRSRMGRHPMTRNWNSGDSQQSHTRLCAALETSVRLKTQLGRMLIERADLDLIFIVFGEAHKAGHWLWKYHDEGHPNHEPCTLDLKDGLLNTYRQLDQAVAELAALISPHDSLIVFSDHGMQPAYRGEHLIDLVLEKLGYLVHNTQSQQQNKGARASPFQGQLRRLLSRAKSVVRARLPRDVVALLQGNSSSFPTIDWSRTQAFSLPTDRNSYIRVNLKGREPLGIVEPGAGYDALLDDLENAMRDLINPLTGRPAVDQVFRLRSQFPGERADDLPDLAILWRVDAPIDEVTSPSVGVIRRPIRELRSGNHREEGFLLARGPSFTKAAETFQGHIQQIAPTLLRLHRVPIPDQFEMPPLEQILTSQS